jgi:short-subunit dehydrogenase
MDIVTGQKIWIIGASSGIGAALAAELSRRGAQLTLSARRRGELEKISHGLKKPAVIAPVDVSDIKSLHDIALVHGPFDSVIFLAAIYNPGLIEDMKIDNAHQMVNINIGGALNMIDAVYPGMRQAGKGQIVLCGSVAGYCGLPNSQPYSLTKAAIMNLAQSLKVEAERYGIDVKLISPGFVRTPLTDQNDFDMPMLMEPEDAARVIADGLTGRAFEIHFPRKFTCFVKLLSILPYSLYFLFARSILNKKIGNGT